MTKHTEGSKGLFQLQSQVTVHQSGEVREELLQLATLYPVKSKEKQMHPCWPLSSSLLRSYTVQDSLPGEYCSPLDSLLPHQVIIKTIPYRHAPSQTVLGSPSVETPCQVTLNCVKVTFDTSQNLVQTVTAVAQSWG